MLRAPTPDPRGRKRVPTAAELNMSQREVMLLTTQVLNERRVIKKVVDDLKNVGIIVEALSEQVNSLNQRFDQLCIAFVRFQGMVGIEMPATVELAARRRSRPDVASAVTPPPRPMAPARYLDGEFKDDPIEEVD